MFCGETMQTKMQKSWVFSSTNMYLWKCQTAWWQKRGWRANFDRIKFSSSPLIAVRKQCQLVQTSYIKRIKLFLFGHIINILLTELGRSVWENLDLVRWYRPHCVRSVLATSVKILPYRPPARLIRTKYRSSEVWTKVIILIHGWANFVWRFLTFGELKI